MKNLTKKTLSTILAAASMATVFAGCGSKEVKNSRRSSDEDDDEPKQTIEMNDDEEEEEEKDENWLKLPEPVELLNVYEIGTHGGEPVTWVVIDIEDDKALLITEQIVDCVSYNEVEEKCTWEDCTLREWLNDDFYNDVFTDKEKQMILKTTLDNKDLPKEGYDYGNDTEDYIFILSPRDVEHADVSEASIFATSNMQIAVEHGLNNTYASFWVRTPCLEDDDTVDLRYIQVVRDGEYCTYYCVDSKQTGVRPAMWVDKDMLALK